jgi:hypothetical protein
MVAMEGEILIIEEASLGVFDVIQLKCRWHVSVVSGPVSRFEAQPLAIPPE